MGTESTKYTMVYPHDSTLDNTGIERTEENLNKASIANYKMNTKIYGDGIRETSMTGTDAKSWNKDYSIFVGLYCPFIIRGGYLWNSSGTGSFSFARTHSTSHSDDGFRPVVVPVY